MELLKRDYLTVTDDGENICMELDTTHDAVQEVARKMSEIRPGLKMDGKGWEAFLKYYLDGNNPALLKDLSFKKNRQGFSVIQLPRGIAPFLSINTNKCLQTCVWCDMIDV